MELVFITGAFIRWAIYKFDGNFFEWYIGKKENFWGNLIIGFIVWLIILVIFFVLIAILR